MENENQSAERIDPEKLKALREKVRGNMPAKIVEKKTRSLKFGIVGTGQAGSRLAETFASLDYEAIAINTAAQDLEHINLPEYRKFLLNYGLGGAAKDLEIGKQAAEEHRDALRELIHNQLSESQMFLLCFSLGGGSGAGSSEVLIDLLVETGKPIVVITVLPMSGEDGQTKKNALETLSALAKEVQNGRIHNLIVVDNAKIEAIYSNTSQMEFFGVSNQAIVEPLDAFNIFSSKASAVKALDSQEFGTLMVKGGGLSVYGSLTVDNYEEETAIAEAVMANLNSNLLANKFDLSQSKYVGVMLIANPTVWSKIPASSVNYAMSMIADVCGTPAGIFKGMYTADLKEDVVKVYSMFTGLGLPVERVQQLKKEAQESELKLRQKDNERVNQLRLDTGTDDTVSAAEKVKQRIAAKKSPMSALMGKKK